MSASLRFLALALAGWAGVRAATLGMVPGLELASAAPRTAPAKPAAAGQAPTIMRSDLPPIEPALQPVTTAELAAAGGLAMLPQAMPFYYPLPAFRAPPAAFVPASLPQPRSPVFNPILPEPAPVFYSPIPQLDEWPLSRMASLSFPARRSATAIPEQSAAPAVKAKLDRLQLTAWALLRGQQGQIFSDTSLASGGTLGGSQTGMRLTYHVTRSIAASVRGSATVGRRGGEVAAGVRITPFRTIPVSLTAERRQAIGRYGGGRSAFALFAEGGLYQRPVAWNFSLDAYLQGGVVGIRSRDLFVDGGATLTRPLFGRFSAGFGVWGGAQPGLYRVDAGPRISMQVRRNVRVHADWRQRLAGNAAPGSGPALTLAGDF